MLQSHPMVIGPAKHPVIATVLLWHHLAGSQSLPACLCLAHCLLHAWLKLKVVLKLMPIAEL